MTGSVLIPSHGRPEALRRCLESLAVQTVAAHEIVVIWQADDDSTRIAAEGIRPRLGDALRVVHSATRGVVPAENAGLEVVSGDVVLLIDDDATAPNDWVESHLRHYDNPRVGAVGGPAANRRPDGSPFPTRRRGPQGRVSWWGKVHGNMYDHPEDWRSRGAKGVHHLVGYNMSLRRAAFDKFEDRLRPYWQLFELDACLQCRRRGFEVVFDYCIVVDHMPTNTAYCGGRDGDLESKLFNPTYNQALVLSKYSRGAQAAVRLAYLLGVGTTGSPGLAAAIVTTARGGSIRREAAILLRSWRETLAGWAAGRQSRDVRRGR